MIYRASLYGKNRSCSNQDLSVIWIFTFNFFSCISTKNLVEHQIYDISKLSKDIKYLRSFVVDTSEFMRTAWTCNVDIDNTTVYF